MCDPFALSLPSPLILRGRRAPSGRFSFHLQRLTQAGRCLKRVSHDEDSSQDRKLIDPVEPGAAAYPEWSADRLVLISCLHSWQRVFRKTYQSHKEQFQNTEVVVFNAHQTVGDSVSKSVSRLLHEQEPEEKQVVGAE